ncbi:hypothetical protein U8335_13755 [Roseiconus lacunae]|uniref:DUF6876 family protein n=1 Tax=Roseiconus lacunae TaxID=2605694 RepID=UPI003087BED6|nr:hypothetical protein U8335_13755 [Stieleria sp. HD01]
MQKLTKDQLNQFTGDMVRYRHLINRKVIYTPGVKYLAEKAEAYWLIDAIASWIGSEPFEDAASKDDRIGYMHFWTLTVHENGTATLAAKADSPEKPFISQQIPFTDFPLDSIDIWAAVSDELWTLYLPSEH